MSLSDNYKLIFDPHIHTTYTHGVSTILEIAEVASSKGLTWVAITEHGPGNYNYGLDLSDIPRMKEDILEAKKVYPNLEIKLGIELNSKYSYPYVDLNAEELSEFDIVLCGYHYSILGGNALENKLWSKLKKELHYKEVEDNVYQADLSTLLVKNTRMILNALDTNKIDILTHIGDKGPFDICDISKKCEETGTLLEVNLKHKHLNLEELKIAKNYNVNFVISSDAHNKKDVGVFEPQLELLLEAGIDVDRIVNIEKK